MILVCPFCQSRFLVPASAFAAGTRRVRCGRCAHTWEASPPNEIDVVAVPEPLIEANPQQPIITPVSEAIKPEASSDSSTELAPASTVPTDAGRKTANVPAVIPPQANSTIHLRVAAGILLVILLAVLVWNRQTVAGRWPGTESIYNSLGLHINHTGEGILIEDVRSERVYDGGIMRLVVEGKLHNVTQKHQLVPNIKAAALGADGHAIQSWQIGAPAAKLAPGEVVPFQTSIRALDQTVVEVNLEFVELKHDTE